MISYTTCLGYEKRKHKQANTRHGPLGGEHHAEEDPLGAGNWEPVDPTRKKYGCNRDVPDSEFRIATTNKNSKEQALRSVKCLQYQKVIKAPMMKAHIMKATQLIEIRKSCSMCVKVSIPMLQKQLFKATKNNNA